MRKNLISKIATLLSFAIMGTTVAFAEEISKEVLLNDSGEISIYEIAEKLNHEVKKTDDNKYTTINFSDKDTILLSDGYYTIHLNGVAKFTKYNELNGFLVPHCEKISLDTNSDVFISKEFIEANKEELHLDIKDGKIYSSVKEETATSEDKKEVQENTSATEEGKEDNPGNNSNTSTIPDNNNNDNSSVNKPSGGNNVDNGSNGNKPTTPTTPPAEEETPKPPVEEETPTPPVEEKPAEPEVDGNGVYINTPSDSYLTSLGLRYEGYRYVLDDPDYTPDNQLGILPYLLEVEVSSGNITIKYNGSLPTEGYSLLYYVIPDSTAANQAISESNSMTTVDYGNYSVYYRPGQSVSISY